MSASRAFLSELFPELPSGLRVPLWRLSDRRSLYVGALEEATNFEGARDLYVSAALITAEDAERIGPRGRLKARDASAIPGVWADIDVSGTPDGRGGVKTGAAPSHEGAMELAFSVLEPTIIVNSGYGIQAWWLLEEPWAFGSDDEREQAAQIVRSFQATLRERADFGLDATHDLARLMRLPGTLNGKGEAPVPVESTEHDGPRYELEDLVRLARPMSSSGALSVEPATLGATLPAEKFTALMQNSETFRRTWEHARRDRPEWSTSEYDHSLASQAARAGWTEPELAALIREHRRSQNGAGDAKAERPDYIERTVAKASAEVPEQSPPVTYTSTGEALSALEHLSRLLKMDVRRVEWRRAKRSSYVFWALDPSTGEERASGAVDDVLVLSNLQKALHAITGRACTAPRRNSEEWQAIQDAITAAAEIVEVGDEEAEEWRFRLGQYMRDRLGMAPQGAAETGEPYEDDGCIYINRPAFQHFLRVSQRMRAETTEVSGALRDLGFEPNHDKHYTKASGKRGSRSYWKSPPRWTW